MIVRELIADGQVQEQLAEMPAVAQQTLAQAIAIQQIPAPTFAEQARAQFVQAQFNQLGLQDVTQDGLHNVYGHIRVSGQGWPVILSAHTDTVFEMQTDLTIRHENGWVCGPGLGDNSLGVAGLLIMGQILPRLANLLRRDIWLVANVGEEGLGNLRGMQAVADRFGAKAHYIVIEGGLFGQIIHTAIGVQRFRITVNTPGGHSWGAFGTPNAIHVLSRVVAGIDQLHVPSHPKTSYNVGTFQGGSSVNTIASSASLLLDLRSEEPTTLAQLVDAVREIVKRHNQLPTVQLSMEEVGNRPAGTISRQAPIVQWATEALQVVGCRQISYEMGSTDANIPLSQGWSAVCIGLTQTANAHRLDEQINPSFLPQGLAQLLLLTLAASSS